MIVRGVLVVAGLAAAELWLVGGAGCGRPPAGGTSRRFTDEQLKAKFAWDLGPDAVDVSGYPAAHQKHYRTFQDLCGRCHSTARALNAPIVTRDQWNRYVHRMHFKSDSKLLTKATGKAIVDFLAHDAAVRKVGRRDAFLNELSRLQDLYADLEVERARVLLERAAEAGKDRGYVSP
jgi:hypothetical protein